MLGMPVSLHIYPYGDHGIALATEKTSWGNSDWIQPLAAEWVGASVAWMKTVKALDKQSKNIYNSNVKNTDRAKGRKNGKNLY